MSGVLGESRTHSGLGLGFGARDDGAGSNVLRTLLAFLVILAALALVAAAATRRTGVPAALLARRRRRFERPLLFLDVDGVITLWPSLDEKPPGSTHDFDAFRVYISEHCGEYIRLLETRYEIVWATGWEDDANRYLREALGLERDLPTLRFGQKAQWGTSHWKIKAIVRAAGRRPMAWVDDNIGPEHRGWARNRAAPTLLVKTSSRIGISEDNVRDLIDFADWVAHESHTSVSRRHRASSPA